MKRILTLLLCIVLITGTQVTPAYAAPEWPSNVSVEAEGAVLMDARSGAVIYGKNLHAVYYPASITKILTALIVIEHCNLDDVVTFSHDAIYSVEQGSSSAGMDVGDKMTVRDCLYAMLLKSANEVANALAEHTAGSIQNFAVLMNAKAKELGCQESHFNNPSGLNDPQHYTSAYDMALIAQAAFQNETFVTIDSSLYYDLPPTRHNPDGFRVYPGHRMLKKNAPQYYAGVIGGKTGYTTLAGNTLVTCAEKNGMKLITVILNGHQTHYSDTKALLDFGFANFQSVNIADADSTYSAVSNDMTIAGLPAADLSVLHMQKDCYVTLPKTADISEAQSSISYDLPDSAPPAAVARISYQYNDRQIGASYLLHKEAGDGSDVAGVSARTDAAVSTQAENEGAADGSGEAAGANARLASGESAAGGSGLEAGAEYGADVSLSGAADGESSFSQDPLELAETDPLVALEGAEKKQLSGTRKTGIHLNIPPAFWIIVGVAAVAAILGSGLLTAKYRIEKREEEERSERYERRRQRLQDIGMTTSEFDMMLQQKRSDSALKQTKPRKRPKKHKSFLDEKNFRDHE